MHSKAEKSKKFYMKNWRPISLLNVVHKIASGSIANRTKTVFTKPYQRIRSVSLKVDILGKIRY